MTSARIVLAALVCSATLAFAGAGSASAALSTANSKCRDFIGQKIVTLEDTLLKEQVKCHGNRSRGALDPSVNDIAPLLEGLVDVRLDNLKQWTEAKALFD